ncbi:MAG: hypothetical protein AAGF71_05800 [Pseudomonadota bacterium]
MRKALSTTARHITPQFCADLAGMAAICVIVLGFLHLPALV